MYIKTDSENSPKMNLKTVLEEIARREGFCEPSAEMPSRSEDQGLLSEINVVPIREKSQICKERKLSLIIKSAATNEKLREFSAVPKIFGREAYMYKTVFPAFYEFESDKGIENPFCTVPKCYYVSTASKPEILILENFKEKGYRVWNRWLEMEDRHVRMVMEQYAKLHAVSFAMQDQKPELFRELTENFEDVFDIFLEKSGFFHTHVYKTITAQACLNPKTDKAALKKYFAFLEGLKGTFKELMQCKDKHRVILHGDCWTNNMMFKFEDSGVARPTSMRLIDFQLSKLGSPARDLSHFFYCCASKKILDNFNVYRDVYYESLVTHLRRLRTNPEKVYSFSALQEDLRKFARYGILLASVLRYAMLSEKDEIISFSEVVESGSDVNTAFNYDILNINKYKDSMRNIIIHCAENNFI